jgi:ABC-2 type transport system ATP-binding protein
MDDAYAIRIDALCKTYRQKNSTPIHAVRDLSLAVPPGQVFGFLGPNGAGKTTTIKCLCGLVQPTSGQVWVNGVDPWRRRGAAMRQIGAVLEGTRNVHWTLSAWDNLLYFGHLKGVGGKALSTRAKGLLSELELWDRRRDLVRTFSRGMQQKVAVACALVADPPVVLLDEPTLGLDVQAARAVRELIARLAQDQGKTVVLTTHQLDLAEELCDRVAIIRLGSLVADQPVGELLELFSGEYYEIRVQGVLPPALSTRLEAFTIREESGQTVLSGDMADQDLLYDLLGQLRAAGLPLLAAQRAEPDLEEVFVRLVGERGEAIPEGDAAQGRQR